MTALRVVVWLAGASLIGWTALQVERVFYFLDGYDGLTLLAAACAVALLTAATAVRFARLRAAPLLLALLWLVPYVGAVPTLPAEARTLADATSWVLPGLAVLALLGSQGGRAAWRPAAGLAMAGSTLAVLVRLILVDPFLDIDCWPVCLPNPYAIGSGGAFSTALFGLSALLVLAGLVETLRRPWGRSAVDRGAELAGAVCTVGLLVIPAADSQPGEPAMRAGVAAASLGALIMAGSLLVREAMERELRRRLTDVAIDLTASPGPGQLTDALSELLDDPDLVVRYWSADHGRFVDEAGAWCDDPRRSAPDRTTEVVEDGQLRAVIIHRLPTPADRVTRAMSQAMRLAMLNQQLRACSLAELGELQDSRQRILERAADERRALERNLHDGAQQRVVSLILMLRILAARVHADQIPVVEEAAQGANSMLNGLREVARGIHPAIVSDVGLSEALAELGASSARMRVQVRAAPAGPLSPTAQTTAYELVSATLAAADAESASSAAVTVDGAGDRVVIDVVHDAPSGATAALVDTMVPFVEALSGSVRVAGGVGAWRVRLELPCVS